MAGEHSRVGKMLVFGAGNVAYSVVPALQAVNGDSGVEVYSRSERSAAALGAAYGVEWHSGFWMPGGAYTVCVVAVPDDAVRTSVERAGGAAGARDERRDVSVAELCEGGTQRSAGGSAIRGGPGWCFPRCDFCVGV